LRPELTQHVKTAVCSEPLDLPFIARLHKVWAPADFIVVTAPSTSETEGMIGKRDLALMRKRWVDDFVTIAMGPVAAAYAEDIKAATFRLPRASTIETARQRSAMSSLFR
jgi:D-isomer specific 2-hydroxyacid dehydrogenase-like protein